MNHDVVMEALASDPITDFAIQLLATGVGAALGFLAAMLVSSLNNKDNTKVRKKNTIKAIHEELKSLEKGIEELKDTTHIKWNQDKLEFEGGWLSVSTPAFHSSVNSGDFSLLDTKLQTEIGDVYLSIDELKIFTQQRLQFPFSIVMQSSESKKEGDRIVENTNHVMDKLNAQLTPLLLKLKK